MLPHDGLGQVYKAKDTEQGHDVMVTLLDLDADARDREAIVTQMQKSVLKAAALQHPGLVRIVDAGVVGQGVYIVNDWTPGRSLAMAQHAGWQPTARLAAELVRDLALALAHAHAHGVLHGGLNPSTVMLDAHDRAAVLGLGYAGPAHASDVPSMDPLVSGAAPYLAPEQLQGGAIDERTDVHALGVLLYELLAGNRAYPGGTVPEVARALMAHDPAPPHWLRLDVPERLSAIAMQALQRNPAARYAQVGQVAAALNAWLEQSELETDETRDYFAAPQPEPELSNKKRYGVSASLLAAAAVVLAFTWVERADTGTAIVPAYNGATASGVVTSEAAVPPTHTSSPEPSGAGPTAPAATNARAPAAEQTAGAAVPGLQGMPKPAAGDAVAATLLDKAAQATGPANETTNVGRVAAAAQVTAVTMLPLGAAIPAAAPVPTTAQAAEPLLPMRAAEPRPLGLAVATPPAAVAESRTQPATSRQAVRDKARAPDLDARAAAAPTALQTGTVQLAVSPWGYVEVGGKLAGATPPLQKLTLPEGTHTITIRNEDFVPYVTTIQVSADRAATVRHRFAQ